MTPDPSARPAPTGLPFVVFGLLTLVSFGGPFAIALVLRGGESMRWPPDRPIEWWVVGIVLVVFAACFLACLSMQLWYAPAAWKKPSSTSTTSRPTEPPASS